MAMMEIRRMLVTVAGSFMGMHVMMMRVVFIIMQMSMVVSDRFINVRVTMILLHDHMSGANAS